MWISTTTSWIPPSSSPPSAAYCCAPSWSQQRLYPTKSLSLNQTELTTGTPKSGYRGQERHRIPRRDHRGGRRNHALHAKHAVFGTGGGRGRPRLRVYSRGEDHKSPTIIVYLNAETVTLIVDIGPVMATQTFDEIPLSIHATYPRGWTRSQNPSTVNRNADRP